MSSIAEQLNQIYQAPYPHNSNFPAIIQQVEAVEAENKATVAALDKVIAVKNEYAETVAKQQAALRVAKDGLQWIYGYDGNQHTTKKASELLDQIDKALK